MPAANTDPDASHSWDRTALLTAGTAALGALAGCPSVGGLFGDDRSTARSPSDGGASDAGPLEVQTVGPLHDAVQRAAGLWNANPAPGEDVVVWTRFGDQPTHDRRLADHHAADAGIASTGRRSDPPFRVATSLAHPAAAADALLDGRVDLAGIGSGDTDGYVAQRRDEWGPAVESHAIGRDGWAFVLSPALAAAGVGPLAADEIRRVFAGDVATWAELGGPDVAPYCFLGPDVSGTANTTYEAFFREGGTVPTAVDVRAGRAETLVATAASRENAIGVVQAGGVGLATERGVPTLDVLVDGERQSVFDEAYPLICGEVSLHTAGIPGQAARAFLDLLRSQFGQRTLVAPHLLPVERPGAWA